MIVLKPQPGPQEKFLSSSADITIYGGAAGGGKTYALLLEPLRHIDNPGFGAVIFRRQATQIMAEGGLFDNAVEMYTPIGATIKQTPQPTAIFPSGAKVSFRHLGSDKEVHAWQGSQICLICYDELTHFTEHQFFYMLSRNRSTCGVRPYIRATCNPDADSWVADFISWWIGPDGYAIKERSGKIRYFARIDGEIIWADTREELSDKFGNEAVKSVSFIASSIFDNKALLEINPDYIASLNALPMVERERLLKGNWKIRPAGGLYFKPEQTRIVKSVPDKLVSVARAWDLAATEITPDSKNPDRTAGVLMGRMRGGQYIVLDVIRRAENAASVRKIIKAAAQTDRVQYHCNTIRIPQDPGQAGKAQAQSLVRELAGFHVVAKPVSGAKIVRAEPYAAQWQNGNVLLLEGPWNSVYLDELAGFPDALHDDMVDASGDAFAEVAVSHDWTSLIS